MNPDIHVGAKFPDIVLPDFRQRAARLSDFARPSAMDERLDFTDGYPLIVVFYRGFYCPRDGQQMRLLVQFQDELAVNYSRLVAISVDAPLVCAAYRYGLGASWPFLSDEKREVINQLGILDETEGEFANCAQPYTFVLNSDMTIHKIYNGWFFVGRPTLEELRQDLRAIMETHTNYSYDAYNTPEVRAVRIPAQEWSTGTPPLGANDLPVGRGIVQWFRYDDGYGSIKATDGRDIFFHFTAIPGTGYRTVAAGSEVAFEIVESTKGPSARNVQIAQKGSATPGIGSIEAKLYSGTNRG